jgi:SNF2 family DNA or RNA helicase
MEPGQRRVYDLYEKEFRDAISANTDDELARNQVNVLRGLTRLRQICNSPLLLKDEKMPEPQSAKIDALIEQIETKAPHHKILVFSQFVSMLMLIRTALEAKGIKHAWLTGNTSNRNEVVNSFQDNPGVRVFLISLKAGGTGLNLTAADYVYIVDPWWNPAVENQAIDRSHRIGQKNNVVAVRLICPDTIEEKIMKMQQLKSNLADELIPSQGSGGKMLSREALLELLG